MRDILVVGLGGFLGAIARYGVSLAVARVWEGPFPLGTFLINVSLVPALWPPRLGGRRAPGARPRLAPLVGTGFLGAYTTFSTFEYETHRLVEVGALAWAAANVVGSVGAGFLALRLGERLGS